MVGRAVVIIVCHVYPSVRAFICEQEDAGYPVLPYLVQQERSQAGDLISIYTPCPRAEEDSHRELSSKEQLCFWSSSALEIPRLAVLPGLGIHMETKTHCS